MGGIGSTCWLGHRKKTTVEACLVLDLSCVGRELRLSTGGRRSGTLTWVQPKTGEPLATCRFDADTTDRLRASLTLHYQQPGGGPMRLHERLTTMVPRFGGLQWLGYCPQGCGRRTRKLYLPPGELTFACRICHSLTYKSCQQAHRFDRGSYAAVAKMMGMTPQQLQGCVMRGRRR
jgi:hypothetical protein